MLYCFAPPVAGTISPASGDLEAGAVYVQPPSETHDGYADIADCRVLHNTAISGANGISSSTML